MTEKRLQIMQRALARLNDYRRQAGLPALHCRFVDAPSPRAELSGPGGTAPAWVQAWAPQQNFDALAARVRGLSPGAVLLADFVNPVMADKFRRRGIQFVDMAGNIYFRSEGLQVFHRRRPDVRPGKKRVKGRAFNPAGLKLLHAFFNRPALLAMPYRDIADSVGVALGGIGPVMEDLRQSGYLDAVEGERRLRNRKRLFERWVEAYLEKLRPRMLLGRYRSAHADWWKSLDVSRYQALWGGEVVIARQTPFMRLEQSTVYLQGGDAGALIEAAGLEADEDGDVMLVQAFWRQVLPGDEVDPLIVYADLVDSIDPGHWEVAKTFYGEAVTDLIEASEAA